MHENNNEFSSRLRNPDEIFTSKSIVDFMLSQPEIIEKIKYLNSTFLEPAAGDGAFLVELLKRKMKRAFDLSTSPSDYGEKCLIALSSLYGIELLNDNVKMLVMNMFSEFSNNYKNVMMNEFRSKKFSRKVLDSAMVIIQANMVQGDTLKGLTSDGSPIVLSEWDSDTNNVHIVNRNEYTFESIINGDGPTGTVNNYSEEIDLFADTDYFNDVSQESNDISKRYSPVTWINIYKQDIV